MKTFWKTFWAAFLGCILALIVNVFLVFFLLIGLASAFSSSDSEVVQVSPNTILTIDLTGSLGERTQEGMNMDMGALTGLISMPKGGLGIYDATRALKKAANDNNIKMVLIKGGMISTTSIPLLEELREALEEFHDSGKPVISYSMNYSQADYYVASMADKVYMHKDGLIQFTGIGADMLFFKDLGDMLGVEAQLIRHGKFKAAAEQFIKNDISPENRQQNMEMLSSMWNTMAFAICKSREIDPKVFNDAVDNLKLVDPASLVEAHLIDKAVTSEEITEELCQLAGVENENQLKYISLAKYAKTTPLSYKGKKKIAVIYANGEISTEGEGLTSSKYVPIIKKVRKDKTIDAVVLRVDSPGGDAQAAELIREQLELLAKEKPIVVSFGEYAASGGYWISAGGNHIFSDETTLTGSIGVFSLAFNYGKGLKKHLKINPVSLGTHKHSTMGTGVKPLDEAEIAYMQKFVEQVYTQFVGIVADGRNMSVAQVDSIGQGRIWTGEQGVKVGIVDETGTLNDAIEYAALLAYSKDYEGEEIVNAMNTEGYKVVEYPKVKSQYESLMEMLSGNSSDSEAILKKILTEFKDAKGVKTYARMPYTFVFNY
ncbi:MAG: signal peptide peptidase SppA [Bacteroidales bacterium]|nr:signal peptide peptidase SppA [Bacteroidales bacterium]